RGIYPAAALAELSDERRRRFFTETPAGWQVSQELRQMIVFAPHNLLQDAPFTQLDLVTCRNLLIYFQPQSQKKALSFFHFALRTGGVLVLGPSETTGELSDEFAVLDKRWKVYKKRRDIRLTTDVRLDFSPPSLPRRAVGHGGKRRRGGFDGRLLSSYDKLLEAKMPASFLVTEGGELLHTFGGAERWLQPQGGRPSRLLSDLVLTGLKTSISAATQHALREGSEVSYTGLSVGSDEEEERLDLTVTPLSDANSATTDVLVELTPCEVDTKSRRQDGIEVSVEQLTRQHVSSLESELRSTQENLQATVEELETANEELQATNEELVASNEELQSTNEELHSVNEELHTVNAEHQRKIDELTRVTEDLDNLLSSIQVGVIFLDRELRVRRFTPNIADSFSLLPQDIGRRIDTFSSKLEYGDLLVDLQAVLDGDGLIEREVSDLAGKRYLLRLLEYRSPSSASGGVLLTLVDIESLRTVQGDLERSESLLVEATEKLLEERERLQLALEAGGMGAWDWDLLTGNVTFDAAEFEITGLGKPGEPIDVKDFIERVHEGDRQQLEAVLSRCIEQRDSYDHSFRFTTPEGVTKWLLGRGKVLYRGDEPVRFVGVNFDITHQKELVAELEKARVDAESANVAKSAFLANMSHELRTPLSAILGFADILLSEIDDDTNRERVSTIRTNGDYLLSLLNDILDLSKIEAGKLTIQRSEVAVVDLLSDVARLMRVRAEAKDLTLDFSLRNAVPRVVMTDPRRLRQVLVNLVGNAVKFTDAGRVSLFAGVSTFEGQQRLDIVVADTGVGIEEQALARVFRPFEQAEERLETTTGGAGLGLSISRRLAQQLGGDLTVESQLNVGSRFTLQLPIEDASDDRVEPAALNHRPTIERAERSLGDNHRLDGQRILVADDRRDIRHVAEYFLGRAGADVITAADGQEAIDAVREAQHEREPISLVLMDMQMPNIDGYEATKQLVESGFDRPIVALTAAAMKGERERCLTAGCVDYLTKPIDGASLVEVCAARLAAASSDV
ncbi:MAG: CheR family methyltransferase, partial [Planctomycetota bacterium]